MKPYKGEDLNEMEAPAQDPLELVKQLVLLVIEARTPDASVKGRVEGPHCPVIRGGPPHHCERDKQACVRAEEFCYLAHQLWTNGIPICIDIILFPDCSHGWKEVNVTEGTVTTQADENALLVERWMVMSEKRRHENGLGSDLLLQAVRSYLHFSQISSWLYSGKGKLPDLLAYRIYAPGVESSLDFPSSPDAHAFPICISQYDSVKVTVSALQRRSQVPVLLCAKSQSDVSRESEKDNVDQCTSSVDALKALNSKYPNYGMKQREPKKGTKFKYSLDRQESRRGKYSEYDMYFTEKDIYNQTDISSAFSKGEKEKSVSSKYTNRESYERNGKKPRDGNWMDHKKRKEVLKEYRNGTEHVRAWQATESDRKGRMTEDMLSCKSYNNGDKDGDKVRRVGQVECDFSFIKAFEKRKIDVPDLPTEKPLSNVHSEGYMRRDRKSELEANKSNLNRDDFDEVGTALSNAQNSPRRNNEFVKVATGTQVANMASHVGRNGFTTECPLSIESASKNHLPSTCGEYEIQSRSHALTSIPDTQTHATVVQDIISCKQTKGDDDEHLAHNVTESERSPCGNDPLMSYRSQNTSRKFFQENLLPLATYDAQTDSFKTVDPNTHTVLHSPKVLFSCDIPAEETASSERGRRIDFEEEGDSEAFISRLQEVTPLLAFPDSIRGYMSYLEAMSSKKGDGDRPEVSSDRHMKDGGEIKRGDNGSAREICKIGGQTAEKVKVHSFTEEINEKKTKESEIETRTQEGRYVDQKDVNKWETARFLSNEVLEKIGDISNSIHRLSSGSSIDKDQLTKYVERNVSEQDKESSTLRHSKEQSDPSKPECSVAMPLNSLNSPIAYGKKAILEISSDEDYRRSSHLSAQQQLCHNTYPISAHPKPIPVCNTKYVASLASSQSQASSSSLLSPPLSSSSYSTNCSTSPSSSLSSSSSHLSSSSSSPNLSGPLRQSSSSFSPHTLLAVSKVHDCHQKINPSERKFKQDQEVIVPENSVALQPTSNFCTSNKEIVGAVCVNRNQCHPTLSNLPDVRKGCELKHDAAINLESSRNVTQGLVPANCNSYIEGSTLPYLKTSHRSYNGTNNAVDEITINFASLSLVGTEGQHQSSEEFFLSPEPHPTELKPTNHHPVCVSRSQEHSEATDASNLQNGIRSNEVGSSLNVDSHVTVVASSSEPTSSIETKSALKNLSFDLVSVTETYDKDNTPVIGNGFSQPADGVVEHKQVSDFLNSMIPISFGGIGVSQKLGDGDNYSKGSNFSNLNNAIYNKSLQANPSLSFSTICDKEVEKSLNIHSTSSINIDACVYHSLPVETPPTHSTSQNSGDVQVTYFASDKNEEGNVYESIHNTNNGEFSRRASLPPEILNHSVGGHQLCNDDCNHDDIYKLVSESNFSKLYDKTLVFENNSSLSHLLKTHADSSSQKVDPDTCRSSIKESNQSSCYELKTCPTAVQEETLSSSASKPAIGTEFDDDSEVFFYIDDNSSPHIPAAPHSRFMSSLMLSSSVSLQTDSPLTSCSINNAGKSSTVKSSDADFEFGATPFGRSRVPSYEGNLSGWSHTPPNRSVSTPDCADVEVRGRGSERSTCCRSVSTLNQQSQNSKDGSNARRTVLKSSSMIFNNRTALPTQSSPAPLKRKPGSRFDYDASLLNVRAIKNAFSCSKLALEDNKTDDDDGDADNTRTLSTSAPASTNCLLGNFEESILNGRIDPVGTVNGFSAEIGASGSFCPKHLHLPVAAFFFALSDDNAPSPYLGHINLTAVSKKGYHIPKKGTVQVTLFNPNKTVVKMFVVTFDFSDMPPSSQTFVRQRTMYIPCDRNSTAPSYLRYLIHLRCSSSRSGKNYLHTDIRLIFARHKLDIDAKTVPYELKSYTDVPRNPKYSPKK